MAKHENKTQPGSVPVGEFLDTVTDPVKRADSDRLIEMMSKATGEPATMWGPSIIGFGRYHYRYPTGHEGDAALVGFSPRKGAISLYTWTDEETRADLLERLGKHKAGVGCVYVRKLSDVDESVLVELIEKSVTFNKSRHVDP